MSTLSVSNITDGTTSVGTGYVVNGAAKAWVNFNGTGTIAARDSFNVSSLTDNAAGDYTVNFNNAFADTNFVSQGSASISSANSNGIWTSGKGAATTTSKGLVSLNTSGVAVDTEFTQGSFVGDLA